MTGSKTVYDFNSQTQCTICRPQFEISLTHQTNLILIMCVLMDNVTVIVNYNPILGSRPWCRRLCPGVRLDVTLIVWHIVAYAWPQFEIILPHQISLTMLIFFYHIQGNVTVSVTKNSISASRPRSGFVRQCIYVLLTNNITHIFKLTLPSFVLFYRFKWV